MSGLRIFLMLVVSMCLVACGDDGVSSGGGSNSGDGEIWADCEGDVCTCPARLVVCQENCVDLSTNFEHCGECGEDCGSGEECISGVCVDKDCDQGFLACGGECVDVSQDPNFCGRCDRQCFAGEDCVSGQCVCPPGQSDCEAVSNVGEVVGGPCEGNNQCSPDSICVEGESFPDGTCTIECNDHADCPDQTACVEEGEGGGLCLLLCNSDSDCREDYDCEDVDNASGDGESYVCMDD